MTPRDACLSPVDPVVLADYWLGLLSHADEESVELHLLECDACGDTLGSIIRFCETLRRLAQSHDLDVVVGEGFIEEAERRGRRIRPYDASPGDTVPCTIAADDDLLIARLAADLSAARRVDLSFRDPTGVERRRMSDVPVSADAGRVILQQSAVFAKESPSTTMVIRMLDVGPGGDERVLGEYTFQHTRTIPGPPAWEW